MKILFDESLAEYTTIKIGGTAKRMYIPESIDELCAVINENPQYYVLGGGSNLLISNKEFDCVINMRKFDSSISHLGEGKYRVGASVRLQSLIRHINDDGYGGIEYLYSVPGLVGGAIFMNAGSGEATGLCISDYIESVTCLQENQVIEIRKEDCQFRHRDSIFRREEYIVLSVLFCFPEMNYSESKKRREERIDYCKQYQDISAPNFGSVFKYSDYKIMRIVQLISLGNKNGIHYSKKSGNWLVNVGKKNDFNSAIRLIKIVQLLHKILRKKNEIEVEIWE